MSITVYQRPLDGSRTHMTRSDIVYRNISIDSYMQLFKDYEKTFKEFDPKNLIKEFRYIERGDTDSVMYARFKMGALASDRDMLSFNSVKKQTEGEFKDKVVLESNAVERDEVPEVAGVVRMV